MRFITYHQNQKKFGKTSRMPTIHESSQNQHDSDHFFTNSEKAFNKQEKEDLRNRKSHEEIDNSDSNHRKIENQSFFDRSPRIKTPSYISYISWNSVLQHSPSQNLFPNEIIRQERNILNQQIINRQALSNNRTLQSQLQQSKKQIKLLQITVQKLSIEIDQLKSVKMRKNNNAVITQQLVQKMRNILNETSNVAHTARLCKVSTNTVRKYCWPLIREKRVETASRRAKAPEKKFDVK